MIRRTLLVAATLAAAAGAHAQLPDQPRLLPTRDVDVEYRTVAANQVITQRQRFSAALQRARLDAPTPGVYSITDYRTHVMDFVVDADQAVLESAIPAAAPRYDRLGTDTVAGLPCTEWALSGAPPDARPATCFTADGVMLRVRQGTVVIAQASRVGFDPQPASLFTVPPAYQRIRKP